MLTLSPQVGELLLQATQSQDLEEALQKVLRDYVELKLAALSTEIHRLEEQWGPWPAPDRRCPDCGRAPEALTVLWRFDPRPQVPGSGTE